jgi:Spy/CpxP family protein refolding chaperone
MRKQMVERMATDLSLTADQRTKLEAIQAAAEPKMRAMFQSPPQSGSQTDRMAKMQALMKEQQAQISAILTPEQRMKFESMQARMPQGGPGGGGPGMGGPGMGGPGMGGPPPGMVGAGMGGPPPGMNGGSNNN